jgi:hypothetical protein
MPSKKIPFSEHGKQKPRSAKQSGQQKDAPDHRVRRGLNFISRPLPSTPAPQRDPA